MFLFTTPQLACYANNNDALIVEKWANESLAILEENMISNAVIR